MFLGDYTYAVATREYAAAVWVDSRAAAVCPAVNAYRRSLVDGSPNPAPAPNQDCPDVGGFFGNTDILGRSYLDPAHPDGRAVGRLPWRRLTTVFGICPHWHDGWNEIHNRDIEHRADATAVERAHRRPYRRRPELTVRLWANER